MGTRVNEREVTRVPTREVTNCFPVKVGDVVVCTVCDGRGATRIKGPNGHEGYRAVVCGGCRGLGTQIVMADY